MSQDNYRADCDFLSQYTKLIELSDGGDARVAVSPDFQGRVMTSTFGGDSGPSFGWLNRQFIASRDYSARFNNFGGEDRFWIGPEAGQFGLCFRPGDAFTLDNLKIPDGFNSGCFQVADTSARSVAMHRSFSVTNYSGREFQCGVRRTVRLLDSESAATGLATPVPRGVRWVGYESINAMTNAGADAWRRETGLICVWIVGMFKPLPRGHVIAPYAPGDAAVLGPEVNEYYGDIPTDRLKKADGCGLFTCDGDYRSKIGISPQRTRNTIGAWDPDSRVLTIITFNLPAAAHRLPYVNSQWEIQKDPFAGDVVNSYNDGRDPITGTLLGPFYELETSSAGAELAPGDTLVHVHRTYHFTGEPSALSALSRGALGIDVLTELPK